MSQNISKYISVNDFLLLEVEFNRDLSGTSDINISNSLGVGSSIAITDLGVKQYYNSNKTNALGSTNNILELNSIPLVSNRSQWLNNYTDISQYNLYFDSIDNSIGLTTPTYRHDTIKLHIISGYNFDNIAGCLLQVRAEDASGGMVDLTNFSYFKQPDILGSSNVVKFSTSSLFLGNKFYDKYIELKVPSIQALGEDVLSTLSQALNIKALSDIYITYSTISSYSRDNTSGNNTFQLDEQLQLQLPVISNADNFNVFIAESTIGDFIEFYGTWNDNIIGQYMSDIESGRIPLYTSNNPNDNYEEFSTIYGDNAKKWVIIHELMVYEQFTSTLGGSSILSQKYSFTQDSDFSSSNYFRPILKNADISASYTIEYICRLSNRMDGSQIIRRASFSSTNPKKYGFHFTRLNVENLIPYKVFNKIEAEKANIITGELKPKTKYIKVFYDTTKILYNQNNDVYEQGTGPLYLKNGDSLYKFKFEKFNEISSQRENVDLSGAYNYALLFILDDGTKIESPIYYSSNMNTTVGELDFKLKGDDIQKLFKQINNKFSIIIKNPDGSEYTFYEGLYYPFSKI